MSFPRLALRSVHLRVLSHETIQFMEIDIRKDTTDNPPLRYSGQGGTIAQVLQTSRAQKTPNQLEELGILDTASEQAQQLAMSNCIKTGADIALNGPAIAAAIHQACGQICHRIFGTSVGPEAIRVAAEVRLIDRFQDHPESLLDNPVAKSRNA